MSRSIPTNPGDEFQISQFRAAGVSVSECASYFKVSKATVRRAAEKFREWKAASKARARARRGPRLSYAKPIPQLAKWLKARRLGGGP